MDELINSGAGCDIDYIVYETMECGLISENIPTTTNIEHLVSVRDRLYALIKESKRFINKINNQIGSIEGDQTRGR